MEQGKGDREQCIDNGKRVGVCRVDSRALFLPEHGRIGAIKSTAKSAPIMYAGMPAVKCRWQGAFSLSCLNKYCT